MNYSNKINLSSIELSDKRDRPYTINWQKIIGCKCLGQMHRIQMGYPINDARNQLIGYYDTDVIWCSNCNNGYISKDGFIKLIDNYLNDITKHEEKIIIHFSNVTIVPDPKYRGLHFYDYVDKERKAFYLEDVAKSDTEIFKTTSILSKMGYSTQRHDSERKIILEDAVERFGKVRILKLLDFLVSSRQNQCNGAEKYARAIRIWQEDIKYLNLLG